MITGLMAIVAILVIIVFLFLQQKKFGKTPDRSSSAIINSPNYRNGSFQNLSPTVVTREGASYTRMFRDFLNKPADTKPAETIPSVKTDLAVLADEQPVIVWFGHSSYLLKHKGFNILVDPVFSGNAAPFSFSVKAFPGSDIYSAADMPDIDLLIITHDHYDHLDYKTVTALIPKVKQFCTALGVGAHLKYWGIPENRITELDWWGSKKIQENIIVTAAPARHFSGRKAGRGKTLWSSFILQLNNYRFYLGGDSGYDTHFKTIGEQYGPFDIAILECGQYGKDWPYIHMMPEETVEAAKDLEAKVLLPVHWSKFSLAMHSWNEPVERVLAAAAKKGLPVFTPMIGETIYVGSKPLLHRWWQLNL